MASAARVIFSVALTLVAASCATQPAGKHAVGTVFEATSGMGTAYIAASAHGPSHLPLELNADALRALEASNVMAFEMLTSGPMYEARRGGVRMMFARPENTSLLDDIPPDLAARIQAQLDAKQLRAGSWQALLKTRTQLSPVVLGQMVGSVTAIENARFAYPSLDEIFRREGDRRALPMDEVEGGIRPLVAHMEVTIPEATEALRQIVERLEDPDFELKLRGAVKTTLEAVYAGNPERAYETYRTENCATPPLSSYCDKTIDGRNAFMVERIDRLVKRGRTPFVAVGAMHVAGPRSILKLLEKEGYRIRRLDPHPDPLPREREGSTPIPAPSSPPR